MKEKAIFSLTEKQIKTLCEAGSYAPSGGNVQPWNITVFRDHFIIDFDSVRSVSLLDVGKCASVFSLGSFTENICIAADYLGLLSTVRIISPDTMQKFSVRVTFRQGEKTRKHNQLYAQIKQRVTNRTMYDGSLLSEDDVRVMTDICNKTNSVVRLSVLSKADDKKTVADILGKADAIRTLNDALFTQMGNEMRFTLEEVERTRDGMDVATLELPGNITKMLRLMLSHPSIRHMIPRSAFEDMVKPLIIGSSHICCLTLTKSLSPSTLFSAGRSMQELWLSSTKRNVYIHPWTVLTFFILRIKNYPNTVFTKDESEMIATLDERLRKVFDISRNEIPFFLFRSFRGSPPKTRSLRLDWKIFTKRG